MLKIVIVTPFYHEPPRQKISVVELSHALAKHHKVWVVAPRIEQAPAFEQHGNLQIHRFKPWLYLPAIPYVIDPLLWWKIYRLGKREDIDLIVAMTIQFLSTFMAAIAKFLLKKPFVVWIRIGKSTFGRKSLDWLPKLYDWTLGRFVMKAADRVFCQSPSLKERAADFGIRPGDVVAIPNGVDVERFRPDLPVAGLKESLGIDSDMLIVTVIGNLFPRKGIQYFIKATPNILSLHPQVVFLMVGQGQQLQLLRQLVQQEGCPDRSIFTGYRQDIPQLMNMSDILVLPSITEGLPQTLIEAYACGLPVVATNVGGVGDIHASDVNGVLIPAKDPKAIAAAVNKLLDEPDKARAMGQYNRQYALKTFALDHVARTVADKLENLINDR